MMSCGAREETMVSFFKHCVLMKKQNLNFIRFLFTELYGGEGEDELVGGLGSCRTGKSTKSAFPWYCWIAHFGVVCK